MMCLRQGIASGLVALLVLGACSRDAEKNQAASQGQSAAETERKGDAPPRADVRGDKTEDQKEQPEALPEKTPGDAAAGKALYETNCATCHGADSRGDLATPGLLGVDADALLPYIDGTMSHSGGFLNDATASTAADLAAYLATLK